MKTAKNNSSLYEVLAAFLSSRLILLLILLCSNLVSLETVPSRYNHLAHPKFETSDKIAQLTQKVLTAADANWYLEIAKHGYDKTPYTSSEAKNWVFFPLYPLLIAALSMIYNAPIFWAIIISNVCFFFALYYLQKFAEQLNFTTPQTRFLVWLTAFFPCSYFFSLPFTESLFFLLTILSFFKLKEEKMVQGSFFFALAILTRPTAILLLPAYYLNFLKQKITLTNICCAALPLLALSAFSLYMFYLTGNALAFIDNQIAWGRHELQLSLTPIFEILSNTAIIAPWNPTLLNKIFLILTLATSLYYLSKRNYLFFLFLFVPPSITILSGTDQSITRIISVLFPLHLFLASIAETLAERIILSLFIAAFCLLSLMYALGISIALA